MKARRVLVRLREEDWEQESDGKVVLEKSWSSSLYLLHVNKKQHWQQRGESHGAFLSMNNFTVNMT